LFPFTEFTFTYLLHLNPFYRVIFLYNREAKRTELFRPCKEPGEAVTVLSEIVRRGGMEEIRFHGRGGQGTVVASKVLASAISREGKHIQAFPEFGVERRGAPVTAYLRIDHQDIHEKSKIYEPDHVVVLDPTLLNTVKVTEGLKKGGWIIVNTEKNPSELPFNGEYKLATIDARAIAERYGLGPKTSPIVNTAILGSVVRTLKLCEYDSLVEAIENEVPIKQKENREAAKESFEKVTYKERHG
jgi:2-oxoacid:acceptor oxidoreductase gamma subunit (pyruvate/2-ketoisovalerate family)